MGSDVVELEDNNQCVPFEFREDFVLEFRTTIKYFSMSMVVLSCILDLAIYKKRNLVNIILFLELTHLALLTTIPSPSNNYTDPYVCMLHCMCFTLFYTDRGEQIIYTCLF